MDKLGICKIALDFIGEFSIDKLTDKTKPARLCNSNYNLAKDSVMRFHPWNCSIKRVILKNPTLSKETGLFEYKLPSGCVRVLDSSDINHIKSGASLVSRMKENLEISYVDSSISENLMDPLLVRCIASYLAWMIAYNLTGSLSMAQSIYKAYKILLKDAIRIDIEEKRLSSTQLIDSRRYN